MSDNLVLSIDTSRAEASLSKLGDAFTRLEAQIAKLGSGSIDNIISKLASFRGISPEAQKSVDAFSASLGSALTDKITTLQERLKGLDASSIAAAAAEVEKLNKATSAAASGNTTQVAASLKEIGGSSAGIAALAKAFGESGTAIAAMGAALGGSLGQVAAMAGGAANLVSNLQNAGGVFSNLQAAAAQLGPALPIAGFAALAAGAVALTLAVAPLTERVNAFTNALNTVSRSDLGTTALRAVQETATRTGASFTTLLAPMQGFSVAANAMGLSNGVLSKTFANLQLGMRGAGLSAQQNTSAMTALTQVLSKGKVQAQELVLQWGNAVPGGLSIAAEAMGTTTQGLLQMAEAGKVLPTELIVRLGDAMKEKFGAAAADNLRTISAQMNILGNSIAAVETAFGQGANIGAMKGLADVLSVINGAVNAALPAITTLASLIGDALGFAFSGTALLIRTFVDYIKAGVVAVYDIANAVTKFVTGGTELMDILSSIGRFFSENKNAILLFGGAIAGIAGAMLMATAPITGLIAAVTGLGAAFAGYVGFSGKAKDSLTAWSSASDIAADAAMKVNEKLKESKDNALLLAGGIYSSEGAVKRMTAAVAESANHLNDLTVAQKQTNEAMRDAERSNERVRDSYEKQKTSLQSMINRINDVNKAYGTQNDALDEVRINRYQKALHEVGEAQKFAELRARDHANSLREMNDVVEKARDKQQQLEAEKKRYGITLDESTRSVVQQGTALGLEDQLVGKLALSVANLSKTELERQNIAKEEIALATKQSQFLTDNITRIQEGLKLQEADLRAKGFGLEAIRSLQAADRQNVEQLVRKNSTLQQTIMLTQAASGANVDYGQSAGSAVAELNRLNAAIAAEADPARKANLEKERAALLNKGVADSTKTVGDTAKDAAKSQKDAADAVGKNGETVVQAGFRLAAYQTIINESTQSVLRLTEAATKLAPITTTMGEAFTKVGENSQTIAVNIPKVVTGFDALIDPATQLGAVLPAVGDAFTTLAEPLNTAADGFPAIAQSMTEMADAAPKVAESLGTLVTPLTLITDRAPAIASIKDAVAALIDPATKVAPLFASMADSSGKLGAGLTIAVANANAFNGSLVALQSPIATVTEALDKMRSAAEQALAAARSASGAGSSGSGAGSTASDISAGAYREGGSVGRAVQAQSVASAVFANAPHFAEGTANTSNLLRSIPGGGIPSILHANEAVIPLSRGRSIPVELRGGDDDDGSTGFGGGNITQHIHVTINTADANSFRKSKDQLNTELAKTFRDALRRNG